MVIKALEWSWEQKRVVRGQTYRVIKAFDDADGDQHSIGEEWLFLGSMFSKFDDKLTLCVRLVSEKEWAIPLIWTPDNQEDIIEHWQNYVRQI